MDFLKIAPKLRVFLTDDNKKSNLQKKLFKDGASSLSDAQLISMILRTGTSNHSLLTLSKTVLKCIDQGKILDMEKGLRKIRGLGDSKIAAILATFELGKRYYTPAYSKISMPTDILPYLKHYATRKTEHFISVSLNGANEIINIRVVSIGTLMSTFAHPREVFADIITDRAATVIFAHNHPSGCVEPSDEDIALTHRLSDVGDILGIEVLDHIIFSYKNNYVSLAERGIIRVSID